MINPPSVQQHTIEQRIVAMLTALLLSSPISLAAVAAPPVSGNTSSISKSGHFARGVAVAVVDTLLLFDHFFTPSSTVTSRNYLARMADSRSVFYPTYVKYEQHQINKTKLLEAVPHVALIGDSLSKNLYLSSIVSTLWRGRTEMRRDWFLDTDQSSNRIKSFSQRVGEVTPLVATNYARGGAYATTRAKDENLLRMLAHAKNFDGQVDQILRKSRFPDLLLIWIGHNNIDWVDVPGVNINQPNQSIDDCTARFQKDYSYQLGRLLSRAKHEDHKVAIIVFGLGDLRSYLKARNKIQELRSHNPALYPYFDKSFAHFPSLQPKYQKYTIRCGSRLNKSLRNIVAGLNVALKDSRKLRLEYSDALTKLDFSRPEMLNPADGWHLSHEAHKSVGRAAFAASQPSLRFLGIRGEPSTRTTVQSSRLSQSTIVENPSRLH